MGDLISRQAVADAINEIECTRHTTWYEFYQKVMTAVEKLPPAEYDSVYGEKKNDDVTCDNCDYSEKFVDGLILCRRTKTSHRVSAASTCGKGKRGVTE